MPGASVRIVTPNFFNTLRIPFLSGRDFAATDTGTATPVVIVDQSFANKFFPGENPIGKHIKPGISDGVHPEAMREIIAVVGDVKQNSLTKDARPTYYLPLAQCGVNAPTLVLRTSGDPTGAHHASAHADRFSQSRCPALPCPYARRPALRRRVDSALHYAAALILRGDGSAAVRRRTLCCFVVHGRPAHQ